MSKFDNEYYNKGYEDGFSDALNNLELDDILEYIPKLLEDEKQKIIDKINKISSKDNVENVN